MLTVCLVTLLSIICRPSRKGTPPARRVNAVLDALLLSLVLPTIILSFVFIWESSFGSLPPRLLSPLSRLPGDFLSSHPQVLRFFPKALEERVRQGVGIDMDQLAAPGLKDGLIRGVLRLSGAASGIAAALQLGWLEGLGTLLVAKAVVYAVVQACKL